MCGGTSGGCSGGADLLHEGGESGPEHLGGDGMAVRIADDPLSVPGQAGGEIGLDFGVDRDDPVPACGVFMPPWR